MVRRLDISKKHPHFDGSHEGPISDPLSSANKIGIRIDADPQQHMNANPFHLSGQPNKEMEQFGRFFDGKNK
ncbi:hypothetical protein [Bacillus sp. Marseille-P3661]|uniref:hypothetical protein n=1 Tax=Bacillus sp. Marseille-P3661 TaxID=1936234 RepID=UPI000C8309D4|nr:hypothetical protein [Bacillus sp. Marseille-P3661]